MTIQALLERLGDLHRTRGMEWTLGSGENAGKEYGGIAYPEGSLVWRDPERWFYGDDLVELLSLIVTSVEFLLKQRKNGSRERTEVKNRKVDDGLVGKATATN